MTFIEWFGLASLCFAGAASPGPSLAVMVTATMAGGRNAGLCAAWSHALGVGLYAALTVLGLGAIVTANTLVFTALQIAGAVYLLWLAWGMWTKAQAATVVDLQADRTQQSTLASTMTTAARDGFAIAFLNPKLAVFMLALFSQFIRPDAKLEISAVMVATAFFIDGAWYSLVTLLLTRGNWIERLQRRAAVVDRVFAVLLTAVATYILWGVFGT